MAVEDKYIVTDIANGKHSSAIESGLAGATVGQVTFEVAAADDDNSIYRLFKNVPADQCIAMIIIQNDAITSGTDWDLGLYETTTDGSAKDADVLVDGADLSSAGTNTYVMVDPANYGKALFELAGDTLDARDEGYDICLTANTVGSGAGTVSVTIIFGQGR